MPKTPKLSHFKNGQAHMVNVGAKETTTRTATAEATVMLPKEARAALNKNKKGDPMATAQLAGIMAAKKTSELIPLCHQIALSNAEVNLARTKTGVRITATARTNAQTGVEMEALVAANIAALTVYDMLKAATKGIEITRVRLLSKTGGKSGNWKAK